MSFRQGLAPLLLTLLAGASAFGQNLVPNPGLENNTPFCGIYNTVTFNQNVQDWYTPTAGSPDIYSTTLPTTCPNAAVGSTNNNSWGSEAPAGGQAMAALITYCEACASETREYMQAELTQAMDPGVVYRASMLVSLGDRCRFASNGLGFHFSVVPPNSTVWPSLPVIPQVKALQVITTTQGWVEISGEFTADEAYQYITIGNFDTDANTALVEMGALPEQYATYFVDEILVVAVDQQLIITGDTLICLGQSATLTVLNSNGTVNWVNATAPGTVLGSDTTLVVNPTSTSTYFAYGAMDTASFTVQVVAPPSVDLGNDTTLCEGQVVLLNAFNAGANYLWSDGSTGATLTVTQGGNYAVTVQVGECLAMDSILVTFAPVPQVELGNDTLICPGTVLELDAFHPEASYLWSTGSNAAMISVEQPGVYWVQASLGLCSTSDTVVVTVDQPLGVEDLVDAVLCLGDSLLVDLGANDANFLWNDGSNGPVQVFQTAGNYSVQIQTDRCSFSISFILQFLECDPTISMPNVFSPNGDGMNDQFAPIELRGMQDVELFIYNRWGTLIHSTRNVQAGWNGGDSPEGTYFWIVRYVQQDRTPATLTGHVTLLR